MINTIALIAAILLACLAVGFVLWLTWRWSRSLPIGMASGLRAFVVAAFFTPGLLGGISATGAFLLPCPAVISIGYMIVAGPNGNAGWLFGVLPLAIAWGLLWLILYARYRFQRTTKALT